MNESQDGQPLSGATRFGDHADRHDDATQALPVDDSRSDPSTGKASAQEGDRPRLDVGVIVSPSVKSVTRESVGADLDAELSQRYAQIDWNVVVVADRLEEPPVMPLDLMESARDRMLDEDWDLVLVLTDFPLKDGRRVVKTQLSPVHGVGLVVVPALGVVQVPTRVRKACLTLVEEILDFDDDDSVDDILRRARQRSEDIEAHAGENPAQFAARVLGGNVGVLLGLVRANRPLTLALRLTQLIAVTAAAGALMLITPDIWVLASNYGPGRLGLLSLIAVAAVTASLIVGARLWEKPRRRAEREQVTLFNVATVLTMTIGVTVFYLAVFLLALAAAFLLLDGGSFKQLSDQEWSVGRIVDIAWMTASLATLGGAVGAGLEEDDIIRAAAYTREPEADDH
ncbi:hypothetical protein [Dermacoccus barathri]|uniref:hypothetical protein n=1 Tax=Dermacoccus barathri TaxID=322601 RepID=UPI001D0D53D0|nr:hypothetical protein [Dermacoccus barathri]